MKSIRKTARFISENLGAIAYISNMKKDEKIKEE